MQFVEPCIKWPTDKTPFYELRPASEAVLKRAANMYGANVNKGEDYVKDKYFLGEGGFEDSCKSSMSFWYSDPPKVEIAPRHNIYHPDDMGLELSERRLIGSFKTRVRCYQLSRYNVCPDCKTDRMGWDEGQEHDCPDPGPANPSTRRTEAKKRYGLKRKGDWKGWKRNKGQQQPEMPEKEKMPERIPDHQPAKRLRKAKQERETKLNEKPMQTLIDLHPEVPARKLEEVMTSILLLPPDSSDANASNSAAAYTDPISLLQARHPEVTPETLSKIVQSVLALPSDEMLGKRAAQTEVSPDPKKGSTSSDNYYSLLDDSLALSELTQTPENK